MADAGRGTITAEELSRAQQTLSRRMAESKATVPHFVLSLEVDMDAVVELLVDGGPVCEDFVIRAAALALREFPHANGAYRDGRFELYSRVNVGVALAGVNSLVVPTVFDADRKPVAEIAAETRSLAARVRSGEITPPEVSAGTFTVFSLGAQGIRRFTPVINPPQAAILAVGEVSARPAVRDGALTVRQLVELTLASDHRILYGSDAAAFLGRIRSLLEAPVAL
jgi:pyruvate dehydrogenase E2 component (dihydrolipoamide acetyltransferase)